MQVKTFGVPFLSSACLENRPVCLVIVVNTQRFLCVKCRNLPFRSAGVCLRRDVDMIQTFVNLSGRYAILTASVFISISISSANPKK